MITGFRLSAALNVAADLGISDLLVDGPRTVADLAAATRPANSGWGRVGRDRSSGWAWVET